MENITSITFKRTSNIFINAGIIALNDYLVRGKEDDLFSFDYSANLTKDELVIECENISVLLEDVYYFMGREVYDTSGKKAREKPDKYFFQKSPFSSTPFFKMKTYGVGALITNDPVPVAKDEANAITFKKLVKSDPEFARDIASFYVENDWQLKGFDTSKEGYTANDAQKKGDSKLFLNEPYIKITRLEPLTLAYLNTGEKTCYLTNESYKKLVDVQNTSPFIKGLNAFSSQLSPVSQKVSWKAMYISRFSPKVAFYCYVNGLDSIVCFFFDSNNLLNLDKLFLKNRSLYKDFQQILDANYMSNFNVYNFKSVKKDEERQINNKDYVWKDEVQFILIYTFYKQLLYDRGKQNPDEIFSFEDLGIEKTPISLISFKADKFSGTLRPNEFEYFNQFKFIISLIISFEKNGINFSQILSSLKFLKNSQRSSKDKYQLERATRNTILGKIMTGKSILSDIEQLYYQCFTYLVSNDYIGFKNFKQLSQFIRLYEQLINKNMTKETQERAYNLGTSIGIAIAKGDAKSSRKYVIGLNKARTVTQFNDAIIRLMNRYPDLKVSSELFKEMLNEDDFILIKQFAVIGALNKINASIQPIKKEKK